MSDSLNNLARIRNHYYIFSHAEKKIADYVLEHYNELGDVTAEELGELTETSAATVVRFTRTIGFKGMVEFKIYLRHEDAYSHGEMLTVDYEESVNAIKQKTFAFNRSSMDETLAILDDNSLREAALAMENAREVIIVGEGGSGTSARSAFDAFLQIDVPCQFVEDPFFQILAINNAREGSVVLAYNASGQARNTIDAVKVAKEKGLTTIGLVAIIGSPITKHLDIVLFTGVSSHNFFSDSLASRICELNVTSTLHSILAIRRKDSLGDYRQNVSDLLSLKRVRR
ncbi:MurR/RpiR family transcriptional regulator [Proteiniclasticum sp. C24MP]|uniref:MurR/RpiR family transcriptional regulator n=1 Tax=Proteiniclasticum sp. C24MP TaxID=3374101 RepID=UPI003754E4AB